MGAEVLQLSGVIVALARVVDAPGDFTVLPELVIGMGTGGNYFADFMRGERFGGEVHNTLFGLTIWNIQNHSE